MLSKVQLFDASKCSELDCNNCGMQLEWEVCTESLARAAIELLKENEKLKEILNELLDEVNEDENDVECSKCDYCFDGDCDNPQSERYGHCVEGLAVNCDLYDER